MHEADGSIDLRSARLVAANAYIGAEPLVRALADGAEVVVAGRTSDPALAIAPLVHHFGWAWDDWDKLAVGAACGHLLECGSQVTGGVFWDPGFKDIPDPANIGFPIAEVTAAGGLVITKPEDTGGVVDLRTVKEQLLYELHDPARYITPDVVLDISGCSLEQEGPDRVAVRGLRGHPAPDTLKVTASFEGSWLGEGEVSVAGPNALARAKATAEVLLERLRRREPPGAGAGGPDRRRLRARQRRRRAVARATTGRSRRRSASASPPRAPTATRWTRRRGRCWRCSAAARPARAARAGA